MPKHGANIRRPDEEKQGEVAVEVAQNRVEASAAHATERTAPRLKAGDLALDFVNTRHPDGFVRSAADLIRWSRDVGFIAKEQASSLLAEADAYPAESRAVFTELMVLREASYHVLLALIHQTAPDSSYVQVAQSMLGEARTHERLTLTGQRLAWRREPAEHGLLELQWALSRAIELVLTSATMDRVKECPPSQGGCGWLFVDKSKNGSRRWCSDEACGSRVRMRRMYARKRGDTERVEDL